MTDRDKGQVLTEALRRITAFAVEPGANPLPVIVELQTIAEDAARADRAAVHEKGPGVCTPGPVCGKSRNLGPPRPRLRFRKRWWGSGRFLNPPRLLNAVPRPTFRSRPAPTRCLNEKRGTGPFRPPSSGLV